MVNRVQSLRSSTAGQRPPGTRPPGELYTNWPDKQIGVMDSTSTPLDLVGVRFFSATANYAIGDHVIQAGLLYRAIAAVTPAAFNPAQWYQVGTGFAPIANPVFTGDPQAPTPVSTDNDTSIATTAFVKTAVAGVSLAAIPVGMVSPFGGNTAPTGWLMCFGQNVSRSTYAALSALLSSAGYPFGSGDGSTTFGLPDLRGRTAAGKDDMGGTAAGRLTSSWGVDGKTLGASGGLQATVLGSNNIPAHAHGVGTLVNSTGSVDHTHAIPSQGTGGRSAGHIHMPQSNGSFRTNNVGSAGSPASGNPANAEPMQTESADHSHAFSGATNGISANHTHTITGSTDNGPGIAAAFPIVSPTQIFNYIIFAGA